MHLYLTLKNLLYPRDAIKLVAVFAEANDKEGHVSSETPSAHFCPVDKLIESFEYRKFISFVCLFQSAGAIPR
jgi:hypothetical protein